MPSFPDLSWAGDQTLVSCGCFIANRLLLMSHWGSPDPPYPILTPYRRPTLPPSWDKQAPVTCSWFPCELWDTNKTLSEFHVWTLINFYWLRKQKTLVSNTFKNVQNYVISIHCLMLIIKDCVGNHEQHCWGGAPEGSEDPRSRCSRGCTWTPAFLPMGACHSHLFLPTGRSPQHTLWLCLQPSANHYLCFTHCFHPSFFPFLLLRL